jgi:hypothetical protein
MAISMQAEIPGGKNLCRGFLMRSIQNAKSLEVQVVAAAGSAQKYMFGF